MNKKKPSHLYRMLKWSLLRIYPKVKAVGTENLPDEPAIIVGNHCQIHGPLTCELRFPIERYTWCAGQMTKLNEFPSYAFQDFWSQKPKYTHWFFKIASVLLAPLSVCLHSNAQTIKVYRDTRIMGTFKSTLNILCQGTSVVIFPEHDVKHNNIIYDFQDKFIDVARFYYQKTGKELSFVPMYIAPKLRQMYFGTPIRFCATNPIAEERKRIREYLMEAVTQLGYDAPEHIVIPYRNIPKKYYPLNTRPEVVEHEKTGC